MNSMIKTTPRTKIYQLNLLASCASTWILYAALRLAMANFYPSGSWNQSTFDTAAGFIFVLLIVVVWVAPNQLGKLVAGERFPTAERLFRGVPYLYCLLISSLIGSAWFLSKPRPVPAASGIFYCTATLVWWCPPAFRTLFIIANLTTVAASLLLWRSTLNRDFLNWAFLGFLALLRLAQANRERTATAVSN